MKKLTISTNLLVIIFACGVVKSALAKNCPLTYKGVSFTNATYDSANHSVSCNYNVQPGITITYPGDFYSKENPKEYNDNFFDMPKLDGWDECTASVESCYWYQPDVTQVVR